jgi:hypothetical protein
MAPTVRTYAEFWPFYLAEHSKPATRGFHYVGTGMIAVVVGIAAMTELWWTLIFTLPALYAFAWYAHFFIEHNKPATFTHPVWSLMSDFRMSALALTGRLKPELEKYQIRPRA